MTIFYSLKGLAPNSHTVASVQWIRKGHSSVYSGASIGVADLPLAFLLNAHLFPSFFAKMCFLQQGLSHWVKSCNFLLPMVLTVHFLCVDTACFSPPQREKAEEKLNIVAGSEADISCLSTPDPVLKLQATAHLGANAPLFHSWVPFSGQLYVDYLTVRKKEREQPSTQQIFIALPRCAEASGCVWECLPYNLGHCIVLFFFRCCVGFWNGP